MTVFSQRDPRWAKAKIGNSGLTIGRYGCVISSVAMLSSYFKPELTPLETSKILSFTQDGKVFWQTANFANFAFYHRAYSRNDQTIAEHISNPDLAVILEVAGRSHWVVATGWQKEAKTYKIADPWLGDSSNMSRYQNNITGAAYFKKK